MNDPSPWLRLLSTMLFVIAGGCIYLFLLNRYLIEIKDSKRKFPIIATTVAVTMLSSTVLGYWAAGTAWMFLGILVLIVTLLGETRRAIVRRRYSGQPPAQQEGTGVSLSKPVTTTDLALIRYELDCPGWHGPDLRIAHVSDFHINHRLPLAYYTAAMAQVADAQPDLLLLTGDFVSKREYIPLLPEVLSNARGRLGTFAILGNHDYWVGAAEVADALRAAGVALLGAECQELRVEDGAKAVICGCEDPWGPVSCRPPQVVGSELALVLTHTADNIDELSGPSVTAVFAGHYHAGQINVPLLGALVVPSRYGRLLDHGHFVVNGTHLFVTAGIGAAVPPLRIYCQPDIFIVDVKGNPGRWQSI